MLRAISLPPEHATLIATGGLHSFTKSWRTPYRRLLAIHSTDAPADLPGRVIVGVAEIDAVADLRGDRWPISAAERRTLDRVEGEHGRWLYVLRDVRRIDPPVPCTGSGAGARQVPDVVEALLDL